MRYLQIDRDRHIDIKYALEKRNISFSKIARSLGLSHTTIVGVSMGRSSSRRVEQAIASALDTTPEALWPERYME